MFPKRPRLQTFDYIGRHRYYLTFCTHNRARVFVDRAIVDPVWSHILQTATSHAFAVLAYVFMPDHAHFLFKGEADNADLRACEAMCKQKSGYWYATQTGRRLWQPSFHDRALRDDETDLFIVRYILENPIRSGLVDRWENYPFLGCTLMARPELLRVLREIPR